MSRDCNACRAILEGFSKRCGERRLAARIQRLAWRKPRALPQLYFQASRMVQNQAKCLINWSGRRDSNPRPRPWQGRALPLSYTRIRDVRGDRSPQAQTYAKDRRRMQHREAT